MRFSSLKNGVSGIMRVKNDAQFIERCVESCIETLDELIIVYNDCSDDSPAIIEEMRKRYPEKIRVFPYEYHILSQNLTKDEYEFVKSLPDDDPRLLCNYYNFALSKVGYQYAMKIDADQLYYTDRLGQVLSALRKKSRFGLGMILGMLLYVAYRFSFRLNKKRGRVVNIYKFGLPNFLKKQFDRFAVYQTQRGKFALSLSGVNVFKDEEWFVTLGCKHEIVNILPPFNGEYDHLIFKVSDECKYVPFDSPLYNQLRNDTFSYIEVFKCPYSPIPIGFFWYHLNSMRDGVSERVLNAKKVAPQIFLRLNDIDAETFSSLNKRIDTEMCPLNTLTLACFNYAKDKESILKNRNVLK